MTRAQEITRAYGGDWHGNYGAFPSPGHSKADRGMTVKDAEGDDVLFNSFNGGDWKVIRDECRQRGLIPETLGACARGAPPTRVTGIYDYADEHGEVLYRTVRKEKRGERKRFVAERPDGRGGWKTGLGEAKRVPYRLPALLAADPNEPVYLTEGERKADKIAEWGFIATAVAFGAKGWRPDYAEWLRDRTVVILPDNDEEGRGFADRARDSIQAAGGRAVVVDLPGLLPKGDVVDWTGTADELRGLTTAALTVADAPAGLIPLLDPAAWATVETPARVWTLHEMILAGQVTYLTGAGATGKSLLGQQLATCIALGQQFMGLETRQGTALYLTCEDDADELHRRQKPICEALNASLPQLSGKLHLGSLAGAIGNELSTFDPLGRMGTTPAWDRLRATALAIRASFIVLDNVAHLFSGNENIRNQVAAFLSLLNGLAAETGAAILLIGHPNKAGDSFSGSTAWENQVRSRLFLERPRDADGSVVDPDARLLSKGKANYSRNGDALAFRWHRWAFVREEDMAPNVAAEIGAIIVGNAENETFLRCLRERNRQRRAVSEKVCKSYAPTVFASMAEAKGIQKKGFENAMDRLFRLGRIERAALWQGDDRKPVYGLREVENVREMPAGNVREMPAGDSGECAGDGAGNSGPHTPTPKGVEGAAPSEAAAPSLEEGLGNVAQRLPGGRTILAPGESADDPVPGWDDTGDGQ